MIEWVPSPFPAKSMSEHLIANPRPSSHSENTRNESNSKLLHWCVQQWSSLRDFPLLDLSSDPKSCRESFAWPGASAPGIWQTATRYARRERFDFSVQASGNVFHSCTTFFVWNCVRKQKAKQNIDITSTHLWCSMMQHQYQLHQLRSKWWTEDKTCKSSSLQCLHAPRYDNTGSRVPCIRLGLQNSCILMPCCFFRELKGFTYAKSIKHP